MYTDAQGDLAKVSLRMRTDEQEVARCKHDVETLAQVCVCMFASVWFSVCVCVLCDIKSAVRDSVSIE